MLYFVMFADSSAMFASRIRLSAAEVLTTCEPARPTANWRRFSSAPTLPCAVPSVPTAVERAATAAAALNALSTFRPVMFSPVALVSAFAIVPPTVPFVPSLLTNTENEVVAARPATVASRSISDRTDANSLFNFVRSTVDEDDADWVASVERRSSRFEMLLSAPSLICRSDRPSLALRMPWLSTCTFDRSELATARPAASSPELLMRRPLDRRVRDVRSPLLLLTRLAWAFADAMLLTTEKDAMCHSSLKLRPASLLAGGRGTVPAPFGEVIGLK